MTLTHDDLAAAYKQLLAVERGRRDVKKRRCGCARCSTATRTASAHVQLRCLALLLHVIENADQTWRKRPPRIRPDAPT